MCELVWWFNSCWIQFMGKKITTKTQGIYKDKVDNAIENYFNFPLFWMRKFSQKPSRKFNFNFPMLQISLFASHKIREWKFQKCFIHSLPYFLLHMLQRHLFSWADVVQRPESYPDPAKGQYVCNAALCTILYICVRTMSIHTCTSYIYVHIFFLRGKD